MPRLSLGLRQVQTLCCAGHAAGAEVGAGNKPVGGGGSATRSPSALFSHFVFGWESSFYPSRLQKKVGTQIQTSLQEELGKLWDRWIRR